MTGNGPRPPWEIGGEGLPQSRLGFACTTALPNAEHPDALREAISAPGLDVTLAAFARRELPQTLAQADAV
jgi:hypothetical protein